LDIAQEEQRNGARPAISGSIENFDSYEVVYLGYPVWWYTAPAIIKTFLGAYDFSEKIIVPFATSGGSGLGKTAETLREIVPMAIVMEGKLLNGKQKAEELKKWADSFEK